ncbi:ubiquitin-fold modifier 1 [Iris pallida]|uniref:Ubiquitin-fold modifier 1 n=1 Tax=Iris pallida TaxID=29817 RepID=A0AAX6H0M8_IRIPA|nr:ubiquitin-fold modifier 1 [Iris pallida]
MQLCVYRLLLGRLLTRDRLISFGIHVPNPKCILCEVDNESMSHLFFECEVSWYIWAEQCHRALGGCDTDRGIGAIIIGIRDRRGRGQIWFKTARLRLTASV